MKHSYDKTIIVFLVTLVLYFGCKDNSISSSNNVANTNFVVEEPFSFNVNVVNHSKLRLEGINGNVTVTGSSGGNSVLITGERRVGSENIQDAEAHLPELQVTVQDLASEVFVKTTQPQETHGRNYEVNYSIALPKNLEVTLGNVNGNVTVDSINNTVSVSNVNGNFDLTNIIGNTSASLVNGQIDATVTLTINGTADVSTVNGNVNLDIPVNTSANFSANLTNGTITVSNLVLQNPVSSPTSLSGRFGNGQGTISLGTVNGNIVVTGF